MSVFNIFQGLFMSAHGLPFGLKQSITCYSNFYLKIVCQIITENYHTEYYINLSPIQTSNFSLTSFICLSVRGLTRNAYHSDHPDVKWHHHDYIIDDMIKFSIPNTYEHLNRSINQGSHALQYKWTWKYWLTRKITYTMQKHNAVWQTNT